MENCLGLILLTLPCNIPRLIEDVRRGHMRESVSTSKGPGCYNHPLSESLHSRPFPEDQQSGCRSHVQFHFSFSLHVWLVSLVVNYHAIVQHRPQSLPWTSFSSKDPSMHVGDFPPFIGSLLLHIPRLCPTRFKDASRRHPYRYSSFSGSGPALDDVSPPAALWASG